MNTSIKIALPLLLIAALPARAEGPAAPAKAAVCAACHGADGKSVQPIYPNLAGQYSNYIEHALKEYRDGARKNAIMAGQAKGLTDAEIHELALYFAAQPGTVYTPSVHTHQQPAK